MSAIVPLEDLHTGSHFSSPASLEVTASDIMAFAQAYDPQDAHLSEERALTSPFGRLVASGWHTAALTMRLLVEVGLTDAIGAGIRLSWPTPTLPGDRLRVEGQVSDERISRTKPGRRILTLEYDTLNQDGEVRQRTWATIVATTA